MLIMLSPSKKQDFSTELYNIKTPQPIFNNEIKKLSSIISKLSRDELSKLMDISEDLANLNFLRYQNFSEIYNNENSKPAIYAFKGDVYNYLKLSSYDQSMQQYLEEHFRILSGLYGILTPFTLIQPYRLEMGVKIENFTGESLYKFWKNKITNYCNQYCEEKNYDYIINLASNEYFSAIDRTTIEPKIINIEFKEKRLGIYKTIALNSKRARSMMSHYIISNKIKNIEDIKQFNDNNYYFNKTNSNDSNFLFIRD